MNIQKPFAATPGRYIWYYVKPYWKRLTIAFVFLVGMALTSQGSIYYFSKVIDVLTEAVKNSGTFVDQLIPLFILMTVLDVGRICFQRWAWFMLEYVVPKIIVQIDQDACHYIVGHSAEFLANQPSGKLASRPSSLSDNVSDIVVMFLFGFCSPGINLLLTFILLFNVHAWMGIMLLIWSAILITVLSRCAKKIRPYSADVSEKNSILSGRLVDIIMNALTVKSFANWNYESKTLKPCLNNVCVAERNRMHYMQNGQAIQSTVVLFFDLSMMLLSLYLWQKNLITTGQIVLVVLLVNQVLERLFHFLYQLLGWNRTLGRIENSLPVVSTSHGIQDLPDAHELQIKHGQIEFQNVDFGYREKQGVLKHFNLTIHPGERVGLVGISGSGKTTIINLLQRFYDIRGGHILIDGQDIQKLTQDSLHAHIAVIPQDTSLFHRSLYDNIIYGRPRAKKGEVISAAKRAYAHQFIMNTAKGYDSLVGDRGIKLSGGQRQRIAIARAILKRAPILILDEATSALDSESELHIQKSLKHLMRGKTVIAIAHRLSTLKEMDRIIVMSKGRILEEGTPAQLLKKKGKYAKLWRLQTQIQPPQE